MDEEGVMGRGVFVCVLGGGLCLVTKTNVVGRGHVAALDFQNVSPLVRGGGKWRERREEDKKQIVPCGCSSLLLPIMNPHSA